MTRTCVGGYCVDHREFSESTPSKGTLLMVAGVIVVTALVVMAVLYDASLGTPLTNIDYMNLIGY